MNRRSAVAALLAGAVLALLTAFPTTASAAQPVVTVGAAPTPPADAQFLGPISGAQAETVIQVDVVLRSRDSLGLDRFMAEIANPHSPEYRHFLTPGQFQRRFGPTTQAINDVTAAFRNLGLQRTSALGSVLGFSGSLAQFSSALHIGFARYRLHSGRIARINTVAPQLPVSVARYISGIVGLDDLARAAPAIPRHAAPTRVPVWSAGTAATPGPSTSCLPTSPTNAYYLPDQLARYYGLDTLFAVGALGAGVTVALPEFEPFLSSDIAAFNQCFGVTATPQVVTVDGGAGSGPGSGEAALDIETVAALAPSATIKVYEGPNGTGILSVYNAIANDATVNIVSISWLLCEADLPSGYGASLRAIFQQMVAEGQTPLAASGDWGSAGCYPDITPSYPNGGNTALSVETPASFPEVTGVGGTSLPDLSGTSEVAWAGACTDGSGGSSPCGTGGGISALWTMPTWQIPLAITAQSSGTPCGAPAGTYCREVPDVSASADPSHGYVIYWTYVDPVTNTSNPGFYVIGGTSAAAPLWAALLADISSSCPPQHWGSINSTLYGLVASGITLFRDITSGNNDLFGAGGYAAGTGYDMATGLGSPQGGALSAYLCPAAADGAGSITATPASVTAGSTQDFSFTYAAPGGQTLRAGKLQLTVPAGWPSPSTTSGTPGYVTATAGTVTISNSTITVSGLTLAAGATVSLTYHTVTAPATAGTYPFAAAMGNSGDTPQSLTSPATIVVTPPPGGGGGGSGGSGGGGSGGSGGGGNGGGGNGGGGSGGGGSGGGSSGGGAFGHPQPIRVAGADRIATAIAASQTAFPIDASAHVVVLTRSDNFPDALAGTPLAITKEGPILLTPTTSLDPRTLAEIERVLPRGATVYLLGGTAALAPAIADMLLNDGYVVVRLAGTDRYGTAVAIANALGDPTTVFEADGTNFPDALTAGTAAAHEGGVVLLTDGSRLPAATASYLAAHPGTHIAVGGPAAHADPTAVPYVGADRYETAALVDRAFFAVPIVIGCASGANFPDALSGGAVAGLAGGPIVLVPAIGDLPGPTVQYLQQAAASASKAWVFGGTAAVSDVVFNEIAAALTGG
jgi:hypothetical protein